MRKQSIVIRPSALDAGEAHPIKVTPGITGWYRPRVHIDGGVRHLNVKLQLKIGVPRGVILYKNKLAICWNSQV